MKVIVIGLLLLSLFGCSSKDLQDLGLAPLTEAEVTQALRDALAAGIARSAASAGRTDGYFANSSLKIALPKDAEKLEKTLRKIGFGAQVDSSILQMNRAAEQAAARAKPVFIRAITAMTIDDAFDILNGEKNAATNYLIDNASDELYAQFRPIVVAALDETSATRYYSDIVKRYNALPLVFDVNPDLADYVTEKAIDGLFLLMAQEEARIRTVSSARSSRLMKRVFGSLD
jgi:glutamine amidotransferase PdxT